MWLVSHLFLLFLFFCADVDAAQLIFPPKTLEELKKEEQEAHKVYVRSHNGYFVGKTSAKQKAKQVKLHDQSGRTPFYSLAIVFQVSKKTGSTTMIKAFALGSRRPFAKTDAKSVEVCSGWENPPGDTNSNILIHLFMYVFLFCTDCFLLSPVLSLAGL